MINYDSQPLSVKNIPLNTTEIRFDNLRGGKNPECIFIGLIPESNFLGSPTDSSTHFQRYGVTELNISLNGNSVNGYPVSCKYGSPVYPYQKFLQTTGRYYNIAAGQNLNCHQFLYNWLWCHKFESETSSQGWMARNRLWGCKDGWRRERVDVNGRT